MMTLIICLLLISSLMVISSLNFTHAIFWLVLVFVMSAAYFLTLKYYYIGLIILIIYVGALAILFLFVIMLLESQTFTISAERFNFIPISLVAGLCFFFEIKRSQFPKTLFSFNFSFFLLKMLNNIEILGWLLYYNYFYPFLIACFILLIAMLGAILTQKIKLEVKKQKLFIQTVRTVKKTPVLAGFEKPLGNNVKLNSYAAHSRMNSKPLRVNNFSNLFLNPLKCHYFIVSNPSFLPVRNVRSGPNFDNLKTSKWQRFLRWVRIKAGRNGYRTFQQDQFFNDNAAEIEDYLIFLPPNPPSGGGSGGSGRNGGNKKNTSSKGKKDKNKRSIKTVVAFIFKSIISTVIEFSELCVKGGLFLLFLSFLPFDLYLLLSEFSNIIL